ncbi:MAG: hypothetical protein NTZ74_05835 [Chloroflexi bacterium]|nr:hypothetical protein [Chloroflexota bacterium]
MINKIALAQFQIVYGDISKNLEIAKIFINSAIEEKCDLILLPELWSSGFDLKNSQLYSEQNLEIIKELQNISTSSKIEIMGTYIVKECSTNRFFNAMVTIQPDFPRKLYFKKHLFHQMGENKYFSPGIRSNPINSCLGKIGVGICFDLRFPDFFTELNNKGADCFIISAHWPLVRIHHWDILLQARAIENQSFVIAVNSVGESGKGVFGGHSTIVTPTGEIIFSAPANEEDVYFINIDLDQISKAREAFKLIN